MFRQDQMLWQESYRILKEGFVAGGRLWGMSGGPG